MSEEKKQERVIPFHYIKTEGFHTVMASGVIGGISPNGYINMNFFVDRTTIPVKTLVEFSEEGATERRLETKDGVIREVPFGILMDLNTAKGLISWLQDNVQQLQDFTQPDSK